MIRRARRDEGPWLTELALRAKAHWGYDEAFLARARLDLTIDEATIARARISALERAWVVISCFGLLVRFSQLEIEIDRFAEPFYLAMGTRRVGATRSPVDGAPLPVLELRLPDH